MSYPTYFNDGNRPVQHGTMAAPGWNNLQVPPSTNFHISPGIVIGFIIVFGAIWWWSSNPAFKMFTKVKR